jgi:hypothetical protein
MENNLNKFLREGFESLGEKPYARAIREVVLSLDAFSEDEAIALLEAAKTSIALRRVWRITGNQSVKEDWLE